jgi:hypothetical protein
MGPAARFNHAMVFDTSRFHVVLFGGQQEKIGAAQTTLFGDVWVQPDAILAAPPPGPAQPEPAPPQPPAPFDITVIPAVALAGDQVELRFTLAPQPVTIDVTVIATTSATAAPAFLANVSIPANLTEQTAPFTVSQIKAALGPGFSPPRNVEIIASADGASRSATLRIMS